MTSMASCRWCGSPHGEAVLDLGLQPACDDFPLPDDPPAPVHPLRLWACDGCGLVQLPDRSPVPQEPRAVEPAALTAHARDSVGWALERGLLVPGTSAREFGSPHGGSWVHLLDTAGLDVRDDDRAGPVDAVIDVFGLMHEEDQRAGLRRRADALTPHGVLVLVFPPLETVVEHGQWNAVRHGHHAYPSTAVAARQLAECGLTVVASVLHPLYGGTRLLAARRDGALPPDAAPVSLPDDVPRAALTVLAESVSAGVTALRTHLQQAAAAGRRVIGYGAASRAVPLLVAAGIGPDLLPAVADASPAKQGRVIPGVGMPVIGPAELVATRPDEVLLFLPDLLDEVRSGLPEVERSGARWLSVEALLPARTG
ncbi:putative zinc binding protein [Geodermatophilus tzadiensis]|uniref:Putative zinc binding protein n=1 Tax=Geodermatophilus tzadiensis TaxID=1137988 RepID=A0A2T0TR45_9ACTN|nr:putative zinc binding protein [Geodermatophilus tzadiensis]